MESFVADVRLVFSNSDKYNLVITRLSLLDFKTTCSVLNLPTKATLARGQKEVAIVERFIKESMYGLSAKKRGGCRKVAVGGGSTVLYL